MTDLIDGKAFAARFRERITQQVTRLYASHGITPGLAVVLVGSDPASEVYVRSKATKAKNAGMASFQHRLPDTVSQQELLELINQLNQDAAVNGILVQLPLPEHINPQIIINTIYPWKDVDGFHPINVGLLAIGGEGMVPCTPLGCLLLLKDRLEDLSGKRALVLGRSNIVGKPMAALLLRENCTVTVAHSRTRDLAAECRRADILVAAVGHPKMVKGDWIKPGAVVVDVGINRIDVDGGKKRLVGDVDFDAAAAVAGAITPVPGGVGPMTVACLLHSTLKATCRQNSIPMPEETDS